MNDLIDRAVDLICRLHTVEAPALCVSVGPKERQRLLHEPLQFLAAGAAACRVVDFEQNADGTTVRQYQGRGGNLAAIILELTGGWTRNQTTANETAVVKEARRRAGLNASTPASAFNWDETTPQNVDADGAIVPWNTRTAAICQIVKLITRWSDQNDEAHQS